MIIRLLFLALIHAALFGCDSTDPVDASYKQVIADKYKKSCVVCHAAGTAGAPRTGDMEQWKPAMQRSSMDELVDAVIKGKGAMPPSGMCRQCSRDDIAALILYMMTASDQ